MRLRTKHTFKIITSFKEHRDPKYKSICLGHPYEFYADYVGSTVIDIKRKLEEEACKGTLEKVESSIDLLNMWNVLTNPEKFDIDKKVGDYFVRDLEAYVFTTVCEGEIEGRVVTELDEKKGSLDTKGGGSLKNEN